MTICLPTGEVISGTDAERARILVDRAGLTAHQRMLLGNEIANAISPLYALDDEAEADPDLVRSVADRLHALVRAVRTP